MKILPTEQIELERFKTQEEIRGLISDFREKTGVYDIDLSYEPEYATVGGEKFLTVDKCCLKIALK